MQHRSSPRLKAVPYIFGLACVAFAAVAGRQAGRVLVIVLLVVCWFAIFALQRQGESRGASPGMRGPIWLVGLGVLFLVLITFFGP